MAALTRNQQKQLSTDFIRRAVQPFSEVAAHSDVSGIFRYKLQDGQYIKEFISNMDLIKLLYRLASARVARQKSQIR